MNRRIALLLVMALLVVAAGCSGSGRPSAEEWLPKWLTAVSTVPPENVLGATPDRETCNAVLGSVRDIRPTVEPPPYDALDAPVAEWFDVAEAMFFECPPRQDGLNGFHQGYERLEVFMAEIAAVLATEADA